MYTTLAIAGAFLLLVAGRYDQAVVPDDKVSLRKTIVAVVTFLAGIACLAIGLENLK